MNGGAERRKLNTPKKYQRGKNLNVSNVELKHIHQNIVEKIVANFKGLFWT